MFDDAIAALEALPGEATARVGELEAFALLREADLEMPCICAQRCTGLIARHVYARRLGTARSLSLKELIAELLKNGLILYEIGVALEMTRAIREVAMTASLTKDDAHRVTSHDVAQCEKAIDSLVRWLIEHGPALTEDGNARETIVVPDMDLTSEDVLGTIDVDRDAYGRVEATYVPTPEMVTRWFYCNSDIYTILKDKSTN